MNYLKQIWSFHGRLLTHPLSARAIALWYMMMHHAAAAKWRTPMSIAEATLRGELTLEHKQFLSARKELVEGGYIVHEPQAGRMAPHYMMIDLSVYALEEADTNDEKQND